MSTDKLHKAPAMSLELSWAQWPQTHMKSKQTSMTIDICDTACKDAFSQRLYNGVCIKLYGKLEKTKLGLIVTRPDSTPPPVWGRAGLQNFVDNYTWNT